MPKLRRPHVASPDDFKITREGATAIFEYADPRIGTTNFTMEPGKLATMTDVELLTRWNSHLARFSRARSDGACELRSSATTNSRATEEQGARASGAKRPSRARQRRT